MNPASLPHEKIMQSIKLIGTRVAPAILKEIDSKMNEYEY